MINHFVVTTDSKKSKELLECGFKLFRQEEGPQGKIYYFLNDKALFDKYTNSGKKLFTTNTLTFH